MNLEIRESVIDYKYEVIYGKVAFTIDKDVAEAAGKEKLEEIAKIFHELREEDVAIQFAEQVIQNLEIQGEDSQYFSTPIYTVDEERTEAVTG